MIAYIIVAKIFTQALLQVDKAWGGGLLLVEWISESIPKYDNLPGKKEIICLGQKKSSAVVFSAGMEKNILEIEYMSII